ncbi:dipeptide ABC transporter ATP-binding protein [Streptomyces sp. NPDC059740]|uniref:ABC transporter ATP-binding protein n=1 Tax=Streptomyces sp. NPDC059740 TaxID=3346926 RepID=UPI0036543CA3
MTPVLEVRDLAVDFAGTPAVRGVSLSLERGEVLGIVGESGSGKSVTSLGVMGLLPAGARVSGSVRLAGAELLGADEATLNSVRGNRIAMVFQDPLSAFTPVYRVGAQIAEAVRAHQDLSREQAAQRAVELLDLVGIPEPRIRAASFPHEFSGGMRQRAMIAMAIANDPDVILADEPTTALDVTIQAQVLQVLRLARRETGAAMVLVSHDLGVIAGSADRVAVMYAGRIVETAPVDELFARPRMPYTLGLIGAVPRLDGAPAAPTTTASAASSRATAPAGATTPGTAPAGTTPGPGTAPGSEPNGDGPAPTAPPAPAAPSAPAPRPALVPIPGTPPSLATLPAGCPFAPRCPMAEEACREAEPPLAPAATAPPAPAAPAPRAEATPATAPAPSSAPASTAAAAPRHLAACRRAEEIAAGALGPTDVFPVPLLPAPGTTPADGERNGDADGNDATEPPVLRVRDLAKTFPLYKGSVLKRRIGSVHAVDGVELEVRRGEALGLVGESGSGKSTTLYEILGLRPPQAGTVEVLGRSTADLDRRAAQRLRAAVQIVFQDPMASLDPRMPVGDIVAEPLRAQQADRTHIARRVPELLRLVGLEAGHAARFPHEFSGGQRQRIGIARALAVGPQLLVLDEPVSALDVSVQAGILNLLQRLRAELGLAYLFVSHDLSVIRHVADRVSVMYLGRTVESGTVEQVYAEPLHPYTQALLSAVPLPDPARERRRERVLLAGDPPSPTVREPGCRFRSRCPRYAELTAADRTRCETERPPLTGHGDPDHPAACHFAQVRRVV